MSGTITPAPDTDSVLIIGANESLYEGLVEHGPAKEIEKTVEDLRADYEHIVAQILAMTKNTAEDSAMRLASIEIGLAFSAEGKLGFVASVSAGVEASIVLSFERG